MFQSVIIVSANLAAMLGGFVAQQFSIFSVILPFDFARYLVGAGGVFLLVWVLLKNRLAERKIREETPDYRQMRREFLVSLRTTVIFSLIGVLTVTAHHRLEPGVAHAIADISWTRVLLTTAALILAHDAWFYWTHRLMHLPRFFRRMHREHHKSVNPTPWTAYSFNMSEAATHAVFLFLALFVVPAPHLAIFFFLAHMILRNAIGHCGYELFPARRDGRPLFDWMTSVTHHDLHHANARYNFGLYFTWWDRLMGTEHPKYHEHFARSVGRPLEGSAVGALKMKASRLVVAVGAAFALTIAVAPHDGAAAEQQTSAKNALTEITGRWVTEGDTAHVQLGACAESQLCGDIVWRADNEPTDLPDGRRFLSDFSWIDDAWRGGRVYSPEDGRTYRGRISLRDDGLVELKGCALVFCQTRMWRRLEDVSQSAEPQTVP